MRKRPPRSFNDFPLAKRYGWVEPQTDSGVELHVAPKAIARYTWRVTPEQKAEALRLYALGRSAPGKKLTIAAIAELTGISTATLYKFLPRERDANGRKYLRTPDERAEFVRRYLSADRRRGFFKALCAEFRVDSNAARRVLDRAGVRAKKVSP